MDRMHGYGKICIVKTNVITYNKNVSSNREFIEKVVRRMPVNEIEELKNRFVDNLMPVRIYLFGSYAAGNYTEDSDLDFYIVVDDDISDLPAVTTAAYRAIRYVKQRPVDIIVGTESRFEARKGVPSVENEVFRKGVLLYGTGNDAMD